MKNALYFLLLSIALTTCTKDKVKLPEPYVKRIIYSETFNTNPNWTPLPSGTIFNPDTNVIRVQNGLLKLTYDQTLIGCAWIGSEYRQTQALDNDFLDKVGVKIKLSEGYFQTLIKYHDTVDVLGHPTREGAFYVTSTFRLRFNSLEVEIPSWEDGWFQRDSVIDVNTKNKLSGKEFEVIYDNGKKTFLIDGVEQSFNKIGLYWQNMSNYPLDIEFDLGHMPELFPRVDKLFVDEIEIYTWTGEKK